jgi:hypothetical protein
LQPAPIPDLATSTTLPPAPVSSLYSAPPTTDTQDGLYIALTVYGAFLL